METRTLEQVKVYKLMLNPMTGRFEDIGIAAIAYEREKLEQFYEDQKTEFYRDDDKWAKNFTKGGPLEWFNQIEWSDRTGIHEEWTTQEALDNFLADSFTNVPLIQ